MHYQRYLKHGDPSISLMPVGRTPEQRFWEKVIKAENDQCWEWQAATDDDGYGIFGIEGCTAAKAHRVSYEWATGIKPGDLKVLHHCDNPPCVNPQHLYLGTPMDNMQDKIARGRAKYIHGEDHYGAKLTARQVRTIRRLRNNGSSFRELAKKYNVTASNIMKIVTRDSWKHI
jgi:hypothetical protein